MFKLMVEFYHQVSAILPPAGRHHAGRHHDDRRYDDREDDPAHWRRS
jgi:hypothetical protein